MSEQGTKKSRIRSTVALLLFVLALSSSLYGVYHWGETLKRQAAASWLDKAATETQKITDTSLYWLSLFHTQLRGMAATFYGSQNITEEEFLNIIEIAEGVEQESVIPLTTLAYGILTEPEVGQQRMPIIYTTDHTGMLSKESDLLDQPASKSLVRMALQQPEKVVLGSMYYADDGDRFVPLAITAPNNERAGVLLSVINLSDFVEDLSILHIPRGLNLRIYERNESAEAIGALSSASDRLILGLPQIPADTADTFYYPTGSGRAHWGYYWDVSESYDGGIDETLGNVVQLGGSALVMAVFAIIGFLSLQNLRVNREVLRRTHQLLEATEAAEQASRAKSDFLANMSHEIRTPMNAVVGIGHLLRRTPLNDQQQEYLSNMQDGAQNLLRIIDDILDVSKIEAGRMDLEAEPFELEQILEQISNLLGVRANEKGLEILFDIAPLTPTHLVGDPLRLNQVLINLVGNAIKFTDDGSVVISIHPQVQPHEGKVKLQFIVRDTGIGMTPAQLKQVFKAFSQADSSTTRRYGGTGLGLHISQQLVSLMGGELSAESVPGQGSQFSFSALFQCQSQATKMSQLPKTEMGSRVLVVDDNEISRMILRSYLESFGLRVTTVDSGVAALHELQQVSKGDEKERYKMVFMDWHMPQMNGIEASIHIKSDPQLMDNITIVMVTAFDRATVQKQAEEVGLEAILSKPVNRSQLFDMVNGMLTEQPSALLSNSDRDHQSSAVLPAEYRGARILVAEDNATNQFIARTLLEDMGLEVLIAGNGDEAVQAVAQHTFDLILMDLQMPEMDGFEATRTIRRQHPLESLPIIAMTAHVMAEERHKCLQEGMNDHLPKPVDPRRLAETLVRWLPETECRAPIKELASSGDLEPIPLSVRGIDLQAGVERMSNNRELFMRVLENFYREHSESGQQIEQCLKQGDVARAKLIAHDMKGLAPVISAPRLQRSALALNQALFEDGKAESDVLRRFVSDLQEVIDGLAALFNSSQEVQPWSEPEASDDDQQLINYMNLLQSNLQQGSMDAEKCLMQIKPFLSPSEIQIWQEIKQSIDALQYNSALETMDQLKEVLEIE